MRDFVVEALVAQHLADGVVDGGLSLAGLLIGALALDDDQRDAVDEQDNIRAAGGVAAAPFDREFVGDVVDVVFGVLPVDQVDAVAALVAVDALLDALAEREQFVGVLAGGDQAGRDRDVAQFADDRSPAPYR